MKKRYYLLFILIFILSSCGHNPEKNHINYLTENFSVNNEIKPQNYTETGISLSDNETAEEFYVSEDSCYVLTSEISEVHKLSVELFDYENNTLVICDTNEQCSYLTDVACIENKIVVCYEKNDEIYLSVFSNKGNLIISRNIDCFLTGIKLFCTNENIILQGQRKIENEFVTEIKIYNNNLEIIREINDTGLVTGCITATVSGVHDNKIDLVCFYKDEIQVMSISADNDISADITPISAVYTDDIVSVNTLYNGNILLGVSDIENNITYLDEYSRNTGKLLSTYELNASEIKIYGGNKNCNFMYMAEGNLYRFYSSDESKEKISDKELSNKLSSGIYDFRYDSNSDKILLFSNYNPIVQHLYKADEDKFTLIADYDNKTTDKIFVTTDNDIYSLFRNENASSEYLIEILSSDGNKRSVALSDYLNNTPIYDFCVDTSKKIHFITMNESSYAICSVSDAGELVREIAVSDMVEPYTIYEDKNGNINVYASSTEGNAIFSIVENGITKVTLNDCMQFNYYRYCPSPPSDKFKFYDENGIYSYSYESGEITCLVNWTEYSSNCSVIMSAAVDSDNYIYYGTDYISLKNTVSFIKRTEENKESTVINIAEVGAENEKIRELIRIYNRTSDDYKIEIKCYKDHKSFEEDLGKGNVPDIITFIIGNNFDLKRYINNGYLLPLDDYLAKDSNLKTEDYYINLLKSENGKIYQTASSAGIVYINKSQGKMDFSEFSYDELFEFMKTCNLNMTGDEFVQNIICDYVYQKTAYASAKFEPDNKLLESLFEIAKSLENDEVNIDTTASLSFETSGDFLTFSESENIMTYPDGDYHINLLGCMAIMNGSMYKDEAWNIIKSVLEEEYQDSLIEKYSGFPLKKSSFYKYAEYQNKNAVKYGYSNFDKTYIENVSEILETGRVCSYGSSVINDIVSNAFREYMESDSTSDLYIKKINYNIRKYLDEN